MWPFPHVLELVHNVLAIPTSLVASESRFSIAGIWSKAKGAYLKTTQLACLSVRSHGRVFTVSEIKLQLMAYGRRGMVHETLLHVLVEWD